MTITFYTLWVLMIENIQNSENIQKNWLHEGQARFQPSATRRIDVSFSLKVHTNMVLTLDKSLDKSNLMLYE